MPESHHIVTEVAVRVPFTAAKSGETCWMGAEMHLTPS